MTRDANLDQTFYHGLVGKANLNLGCGRNHELGFINLDKSPNVGADVVCDLETALEEGPKWENKFDFVLASHVIEHINNTYGLMEWIWKALKPGGKVMIVVPHAATDVAFCDITHVKYFVPSTFAGFCQEHFEQDSHGNYDPMMNFNFGIDRIEVIPYKEFWGDPELEFKIKHWWNVVMEIRAILVKKEMPE